jgi:hypothetical protein
MMDSRIARISFKVHFDLTNKDHRAQTEHSLHLRKPNQHVKHALGFG